MLKGQTSTLLTRLTVAFCVATILGCSDPTPEARLMQTDNALKQTTEDLVDRNDKIEQLETELSNQKKDRRQLRELKLSLEERLDKRATDVAIFRAVQTQLLDDERLANSAISVSVEDGIVTILGLVDSQNKKQMAISIVKSAPGVKVIRSRVIVEDDSSKAEGSPSQKAVSEG